MLSDLFSFHVSYFNNILIHVFTYFSTSNSASIEARLTSETQVWSHNFPT